MESIVILPWEDGPIQVFEKRWTGPHPILIRRHVCGAVRFSRGPNGEKRYCKKIPMKGHRRCATHNGGQYKLKPDALADGDATVAYNMRRIEAIKHAVLMKYKRHLAHRTLGRLGILSRDKYIRDKGIRKLADLLALEAALEGHNLFTVKSCFNRMPGALTIGDIIPRLLLGRMVIEKSKDYPREKYGYNFMNPAWQRPEHVRLRKLITEVSCATRRSSEP